MLAAATLQASTTTASAANAPLLDKIHRHVEQTNQLREAKGYRPYRYRYRPERNVHMRRYYLRQWTARHRQAISLQRRWLWSRAWYQAAMCVHRGEGAWTSNTGNGFYGGMQFDYSTWLSNGGGRFAAYAHLATPVEQLTVTYWTWQRRGWYPWPNTARACGLI